MYSLPFWAFLCFDRIDAPNTCSAQNSLRTTPESVLAHCRVSKCGGDFSKKGWQDFGGDCLDFIKTSTKHSRDLAPEDACHAKKSVPNFVTPKRRVHTRNPGKSPSNFNLWTLRPVSVLSRLCVIWLPESLFHLRGFCVSSTAKLRIWTLRIWGFRGAGFRSVRQVLCGDASTPFLDHCSKHLGSVLGRTELCHEVRNPGPPKKNPNHPQRKPPFGIFRVC